MNFKLTRKQSKLYGIFGEMVSEDGAHTFTTLEHAYPIIGPRAGSEWIAKVAPGAYMCKRRLSPRFNRDIFVLENVPPFQGVSVDYIEIHVGNYNDDSEGCILIGLGSSSTMIDESRKAFDQFMEIQKDVISFELTIG